MNLDLNDRPNNDLRHVVHLDNRCDRLIDIYEDPTSAVLVLDVTVASDNGSRVAIRTALTPEHVVALSQALSSLALVRAPYVTERENTILIVPVENVQEVPDEDE